MKRALTLLTLAAAATTFAQGQSLISSARMGSGQVNTPSLPGSLDETQGPAPNSVVQMDPGSGPVSVPGWPDPNKGMDSRGRSVTMAADGKCKAVHYGDTVNFTLRVDGVADARRVYTHLSMGLGSHPRLVKTDFALATSNSFGGGGVGKRDDVDPQLFHFRFVVPDVRSGIYRVAAIDTRAMYTDSSVDQGTGIGLNRRANDQVRQYCLAVFGGEGGEHRPMVTEFLPGEIERPAVPPTRPAFH